MSEHEEDFQGIPPGYEEESQGVPPAGIQAGGKRKGKGKGAFEGKDEPEERLPGTVKQGLFFVRRSVIDVTNGETVYYVSSANASEPGGKDEFAVRLQEPKNSALKKDMEALTNDVTLLRLFSPHGAVDPVTKQKSWLLLGTEAPLKDTEREVRDAEGVHWAWTEPLDTAVDKYFEYGMLDAAMHHQATALQSPQIFHEIVEGTEGTGSRLHHPGARKIFLENIKKHGANLGVTQEEALAFFNKQLDPSVPGGKSSYADVIKGEQVDANNELSRQYYNISESPVKQIPLFKETRSRTYVMSALMNYSMQDAAERNLVHQLQEPSFDASGTRQYPTVLQKLEAELVDSENLEGGHPQRDDARYALLNSEWAEQTAGKSIRALMAIAGGRAANSQFDDVKATDTSPKTKSGKPFAYGADLMQNIAERSGIRAADLLRLNGPALQAALVSATTVAHEVDEAYKEGNRAEVDAMMEQSMGRGRKRQKELEDPKEVAQREEITKKAMETSVEAAVKNADGIAGLEIA
jgi:hypothetical protein